MKFTVADCRLIDLPKISDPRGNLTFIEGDRHVPFVLKRVYYLYDVPGGAERGGHAHKKLEQFLIAMSGSFDVILSDGQDRRRFSSEPLLFRSVRPSHDLARARQFFLGLRVPGAGLRYLR